MSHASQTAAVFTYDKQGEQLRGIHGEAYKRLEEEAYENGFENGERRVHSLNAAQRLHASLVTIKGQLTTALGKRERG